MKKIVITGSKGFLGKNILSYLKSLNKKFELFVYHKAVNLDALKKNIMQADVIIHLAGVNRSNILDDFIEGNETLTRFIVESIKSSKKKQRIYFTSSIHVIKKSKYKKDTMHHNYALTKYNSERIISSLKKNKNKSYRIVRLPHVVGPYQKPNYNSVFATFCYNIVNNIKSQIKDPDKLIEIIHIKDIIKDISNFIFSVSINSFTISLTGFKISVGELYKKIKSYNKDLRQVNLTNKLDITIFSAFLFYTKVSDRKFTLEINKDNRGILVELEKNLNSGQFSYSTSKSLVSRGNHFHFKKFEKFYVLKGKAEFKSSLIDGKTYKFILDYKKPSCVYTIPGEIHSIKNISNKILVLLFYSSEVYSSSDPDTYFLND